MPARAPSERPIEASEARLRQVIDLVPQMIFAKDQAGRFILVNQATADAYGTTVDALIGKTDFDFASSAEEAERFRTDDLEVLRTGQMKKTEERLTDTEGNVRILQTTKIPFTCSDQPSVLGVAVDVTSLRKAEEEQRHLEAQVEHVQKLGSLGVLAGGIAHDFNNILTGILANTEIVKNQLPASPQRLAPLKAIERASQRLAALADQMLVYSGRGNPKMEILDLDELMHEMVQLLHSSLNKKAKLVERPNGNLYPVRGNASQLRQVVMNLLTNASDALGDNAGEIFLSTGMIDSAHPGPHSLPKDLPQGLYVYLNIVDFGCGMDERTLKRLFEPFFTTKGEGRGLGMAAVRRILKEHHGTIEVTSTLGKGSMFTVLLPAEEKSLPLPRSSELADTPPTRALANQTVLIADDEELVRNVVCSALQNAGYQVLEARDGQEALEVFRRYPVDVVLLDISMPRIGGAETFAELRRVRPQTRVLFSSGYGEEVAAPLLRTHQGVAFIKKPFLLQKLLTEVEGLLDQEEAITRGPHPRNGKTPQESLH